MISTSMRGALLAAGALVINAFIWGVSWWPLRELQALGLHPLWTTSLVYFVVFAGLLVFYRRSLKGFAQHPQLWLLALAAGMTNVGFNWAVTVGDVVRVVLLFYLMPAWSVLVAWAVLGERPTGASLLRLLIAMTGVLIVLKAPGASWPVPQGLPDWLAIMGGFSFALTNVMLSKLSHTPTGSRMLAMFAGGSMLAAGAAVVGMSQQIVPAPALHGMAPLLVIGLSVAFLISNAALQYGAARLAATTTALVMLTEILFASGSSALLGAAAFTPRIWLGGSLIVLAALMAALSPAADKSH
jgi:drug/metabolite transporter (DMT)-like permease